MIRTNEALGSSSYTQRAIGSSTSGASKLRMLFLEGKFSYQLRNLDFFRLIIRKWSDSGVRHDNWNVAFELVDYTLDTVVREQWGNELFCIAARAGCMPMIQHLLDRAQHKTELRTELLRGFQSIGEAVLGNHTDVVEYLLGEEGFDAHLRYTNSRGENVLHLASKTCDPAIFRLLVPRLQESVHQTDIEGDTALMRIIKSHFDSKVRCESTRILLLSQPYAAWDSHSGDELHDSLRMAVRLGDTDMCRLLICDGKVSPHSALIRGDDGKVVLKDKPWMNEETILQLLRTHAWPPAVQVGGVREDLQV